VGMRRAGCNADWGRLEGTRRWHETGGLPMKTLLRVAALVCAVWAVLLLVGKERWVVADDLTPLVRALANTLGVTYVVLAALFAGAAIAPAANRAAVYAGILLMALNTVNELYQLLVLLPLPLATVSLVNLVVNIALLVGLIEGLPRLAQGDTPN